MFKVEEELNTLIKRYKDYTYNNENPIVVLESFICDLEGIKELINKQKKYRDKIKEPTKTLGELGWYVFDQRKGFKHYRHKEYFCDYELFLHSDGTFFVNGENNIELAEAIRLEIINMMGN